jgi:hypothetical protein
LLCDRAHSKFGSPPYQSGYSIAPEKHNSFSLFDKTKFAGLELRAPRHHELEFTANVPVDLDNDCKILRLCARAHGRRSSKSNFLMSPGTKTNKGRWIQFAASMVGAVIAVFRLHGRNHILMGLGMCAIGGAIGITVLIRRGRRESAALPAAAPLDEQSPASNPS